MLIKALFQNSILKSVNLAIDAYYAKTSYAAYRFKSRIVHTKLTHTPSIFGEENLEKIEHEIENPVMRNALKIAEHPENPLFPDEFSLDGPPVGRVYAKYPFKFRVEKGKTYQWCSCGYSNTQPFCDSTHRILWQTGLKKKYPKYRPIRWTADETKDVWFCNCKRSKSRPICDGTHKSEEVRSAHTDTS